MKARRRIVCLFAATALAAAAFGEKVAVRYGGRLSFTESCLDIHPVAFLSSGWKLVEGTGPSRPRPDGAVPFALRLTGPDAVDVDGDLAYRARSEGSLDVRYSFTAVREVSLNSLGLYLTVMPDRFAGGQVVIDGKASAIPVDGPGGEAGEIAHGTCSRLELVDPRGRKTTVTFASPVFLRVRDERRARGYANLILWAEIPDARKLAAGASRSLALRVENGHPLEPHVTKVPYRISAANGWTPAPFEPDVKPGSALDFSGLRATEKPAGKYGRVIVRNGRFAFEKSPDIPRRFFGVNLCFSANYPQSMEEARALARRLAATGYNAVRIHHHDTPMVSRSNDGLTVNPQMRRRFDFLVAACIEEGLYLTTDLYVSRWIALPTVGRNAPGLMPNGDFKSLVYVDEHVFANYIRFVRAFMTHVNPLTGRSLAQEPALAFVSLVNEGNHGNNMAVYRKYPEWRAAWRRWLGQERARAEGMADISDEIPANIHDGSAAAKAFARFLADTETAFVERVRKILRNEMNCPVLLTNMNFGYGVQPDEFKPVREKVYDYVDEHYYVNHPLGVFSGRPYPAAMASDGGNGGNPLRGGARGAVRLGSRQVAGKPYTVTEYNWCYPGRYRGACGLAVGSRAVSCNWSGLWRFAWAEDHDGIARPAGKAVGVFDIASDPLAQTADRATAALFLRGDLDGGRHRFMAEKGALAVAAKCTSGGAAERGIINAGTLVADVGDDFASVWATTLDGLPFAKTRRILVAHLTDLQNEGAEFDDDGLSVQLAGGGAQRMMRNGKARISLALAQDDWCVWALDSSGRRCRRLPVKRRNGRMGFVADVAGDPARATWCYELERCGGAPFAPGERVVFLGDSITHAGRYMHYLQLWENLRNPGSGVRLLNGGIAGETVGRGLARLDAEILPMKADRACVMFGMNDVGRENYATASPSAGQKAARAESLAKYSADMEAIAQRLAASGTGTVLMTPTPYDQYTAGEGKNLVECNEPGLSACAEIVRKIASKQHAGVVELHRPMTVMFKNNPGFRFCADRIHPGAEGHLVMAAHILKSLGASAYVSKVEIDANNDAAGVKFEYSPKSLPFPALPECRKIDEAGMFAFADELNREEIVVHRLPHGVYALVFDGREIGRFSSEALARGVNIATLDTENQRRAQAAAKPLGELLKKESLLRDYALLVNMARRSGVPESDYARMDAFFDKWLKDTQSSPYHSTFAYWVRNYRAVRADKRGIESEAEKLRQEMASARPASAQVEVRRVDTKSTEMVWDDRPASADLRGLTDGDIISGGYKSGPWERSWYPIGNGRLGGMVDGGPRTLRFQFNVDSLWTGGKNISSAVSDEEAEKNFAMMGAYQNFGELELTLSGLPDGDVRNYRRSLDLSTAVYSDSFSLGGAEVRRRIFASAPDDAVFVVVDAPEGVRIAAKMRGAHGETPASGDGAAFGGTLPNGLRYAARADVIGGAAPGRTVVVLRAATGLAGFPERFSLKDGIDGALKRHLVDYRGFYGRMTFHLAGGDASVPTRVRLDRVRNGAEDPSLVALMFNYGRYLLLSCSRPGTLPANLQGLWNDSNTPAWHSDYHTNINLQMNYWGADSANLPECFSALSDWLLKIMPVAEAGTRASFPDSRGYAFRTSINAVGGGGWRWNFAGAPWLAAQCYDHWRFTRDNAYLRNVCWPIMKGAAEFIVSTQLRERPDGTVVVKDGWSPEHGPREDGVAHDQQIVRELFRSILSAAGTLGINDGFTREIARLEPKLLKDKIGSWGQLQEWETDRDVKGDTHRHTSHLYAVYPGTSISRSATPALAEAARVALAGRAETGDSRRSWTWPWRAALWARLGDGDKAGAMLQSLLRHNTHDNLLATHPPFQIDGNLGMVGAVCEMLLERTIPSAWPHGFVSGLRTRGGGTIQYAW